MATQQVNIQITVNGANPASRQIAGIGEAARRTHGSIFNLRNLLLGFTIKSLAAEFVKFSDAATRIDNRLNVLTGSVARSNELFNALSRVANETRSSLEPTIDTYARLERATNGLNLTGQQLVDLTKGINQSFQIFGNTAGEAEAAMVQFTQGLSVGVLRGDELRSVLEQAPRLAKAIADGLNEIPEGQGLSEEFGRLFRDFQTGAISSEILAGGLRKLGAEGKLTSEVISKGLLTQLPKLEEEFARTTPTIANAFTLLENKLIALARSPAFRQFSQEIGSGLIAVVDSLDEVFAALAPVGVAIVQLFPLLKELGSIFIDTFSAMVAGTENFFGILTKSFGIAEASTGSFAQSFVKFLSGAVSSVYNVFKDFIEFFVRGAAFIGGFIGGTAKDIVFAFTGAFDVISSAAEGFINFLIDGLNVFKSETEKIAAVDFSSARDAIVEDFVNPMESGQRAADEMAATLNGMLAPIESGFQRSGDAVLAYVARTEAAIANLSNTTQQEIADTLGQVTGGREVIAAETPLSANDQRKLDSFVDRMEDLRDGSDNAQEALRGLERATKQYNALAKNDDIAARLQSRVSFETEVAQLRTQFSNQAVDELINKSTVEAEAAQVSLSHYRAQKLLTQALKDGEAPTQEQIDQLALTLEHEKDIVDFQKERLSILNSLTDKADQYRAVLAATNDLVASGQIGQGEADRRVRGTEVGQGVEASKDFVAETSLNPEDKIAREIELLQQERDARNEFLITAGEEDITRLAEFEETRLALIEAYAQKETDIRLAAQRVQYQNAANNFGELAELSKGFVKESSTVYKTLFAVSKGFAIADGVVKLTQAILNAQASLPYPANLAAMASVAASGLSLLSTIKSAVAPQQALKDGGFVVGPGGPRDDAVSTALSNGEFVVNAEAAGRNAELLEAINSGRFNAGQGGGVTLNLTQNISGVRDADGFRASGRQVADDAARAVTRAQSRS